MLEIAELGCFERKELPLIIFFIMNWDFSETEKSTCIAAFVRFPSFCFPLNNRVPEGRVRTRNCFYFQVLNISVN